MNPVFLLTVADLTKYEPQIRASIRKAVDRGGGCDPDAIYDRLKIELGTMGTQPNMIALGMMSEGDKKKLSSFVIVEIISNTIGTPFAYLHSAWSGTAFSRKKQRAFFEVIEDAAKASGLKGMIIMSDRNPDVYERWLKPIGFAKAATMFKKEF
jgi:hypothetical protein